MPRKLHFQIDAQFDGRKIRDYLRSEAQVSHRMLCILKRTPLGITRNGEPARAIDILHTGDCLCLQLPEDETISVSIPVEIPLEILFVDDDLLVLNKPAGLAMHETHNHQGDALSNAVAYYLQAHQKPAAAFRAIGRLDKGTSGIVVCALNKYSAARLSGNIEKEYLAVASGVYTGSGTIDVPIFRPDPNKTLRAAGPCGEHAVTHWQAIKGDDSCTLLRVWLQTGRTHQIRVHFAHLGTPLVGDDMYQSTDLRLSHQALHCHKVRFKHPVSGAQMEIEAPVPADMAQLLP